MGSGSREPGSGFGVWFRVRGSARFVKQWAAAVVTNLMEMSDLVAMLEDSEKKAAA